MNWERASQRGKVQPPPYTDYWITVFRQPKVCADCGNTTTILAYRHADQHALCELCWLRAGLEPHPSKRYLQQQKQPPKPTSPQRRSKRRRKNRKSRAGSDDWMTAEERQIVAEARAKQRHR